MSPPKLIHKFQAWIVQNQNALKLLTNHDAMLKILQNNIGLRRVLKENSIVEFIGSVYSNMTSLVTIKFTVKGGEEKLFKEGEAELVLHPLAVSQSLYFQYSASLLKLQIYR